MIRTRTKFLSTVIAVLLAAVCCLFFSACGDNGKGNGGSQSGGQGGNGGNGVNNVTLTGMVRTASYAALPETIFYDKEVKGQADENGRFEITVPQGSDEDYTSKITISSNSFCYIEYEDSQSRLVIIKLEEGMQISDFYFLAGKVVLHSDGETVASGASLKVDGNVIKTFENDRNFDSAPIYKDSIISAYKEGGEFIDASMIPYNNICFADQLATATETRSITANGQTVELKFIAGVTFRLKDVD